MDKLCVCCGRTFRWAGWNAGKYCSRTCMWTDRRSAMPDRFWAQVDKSAGPDGCWLWTGAGKGDGYGSYAHRRAHRVAYELEVGPIPKAAVLRHSCDVKRCCNPRHLIPGTQAQNMRDAAERGRMATGDRQGWRTQKVRRKSKRYEVTTHCWRGHERTPENTYLTTVSGYVSRRCRVCRAAAQRDFRARLKGEGA